MLVKHGQSIVSSKIIVNGKHDSLGQSIVLNERVEKVIVKKGLYLGASPLFKKKSVPSGNLMFRMKE